MDCEPMCNSGLCIRVRRQPSCVSNSIGDSPERRSIKAPCHSGSCPAGMFFSTPYIYPRWRFDTDTFWSISRCTSLSKVMIRADTLFACIFTAPRRTLAVRFSVAHAPAFNPRSKPTIISHRVTTTVPVQGLAPLSPAPSSVISRATPDHGSQGKYTTMSGSTRSRAISASSGYP